MIILSYHKCTPYWDIAIYKSSHYDKAGLVALGEFKQETPLKEEIPPRYV